MKLQHTGSLRACAILSCMLVLGFGVSSPAAEIVSGGAMVAPSNVYIGGLGWNIPAGTPVNASTFLAPAFPPNNAWQYSGDIEWTGNPLLWDTSTLAGQAKGEFGPGGSFTIHGSVTDSSSPAPLPVGGLQDVDLITGTVSGFTIEETTFDSNNFNVIISPILTITGGALTSSSPNFMQVGGQYTMDVGLASATNGSGSSNIDDFANSAALFITGGTVINMMILVPEPSSVGLLVLGMGALALRRRRR